jgi:hypothetical protein
VAEDRLRIRAMLSDRSRFIMVEAEGTQAVDTALSILAGMRPLTPQKPPAVQHKPRKRK